MKFFKNPFKDNFKIAHLIKLILMQKEIIVIKEDTLAYLKVVKSNNVLESLILRELADAKEVLEMYESDLKKLES